LTKTKYTVKYSVIVVLLGFTAAMLTPTSMLGARGGHSYYLPSTSQTSYRGFFPRNAPPALTVESGATVVIDTVSVSGMNARKTCVAPAYKDLAGGTCVDSGALDPAAYLAQFGTEAAGLSVLPDATEIFYNLDYATRTRTGGGHVLTGPIYVTGAEPGDTLEVRIVKIKSRVPWGVNSQSAAGAFPGYLDASTRKLIRTSGDIAHFSKDIKIPLKPFQGVMGTAPADSFVSPIPAEAALGYVGTRPPGPMGGNMDLNDLGEGTSLFLPVFQVGAQFFTGDPHEVQGNGEVSGTALEQSNTVTMQFIVHKKGTLSGPLSGPRAETPTHYILMGIDVDHDKALQKAGWDALDFLQQVKGLSPANAMAFASLAVDFNIAESVDFTNLVMARIPKTFFTNYRTDKDYWHKPLETRNEAQRQGLEPVKIKKGPGVDEIY
jgi:acetamidase/formamidase